MPTKLIRIQVYMLFLIILSKHNASWTHAYHHSVYITFKIPSIQAVTCHVYLLKHSIAVPISLSRYILLPRSTISLVLSLPVHLLLSVYLLISLTVILSLFLFSICCYPLIVFVLYPCVSYFSFTFSFYVNSECSFSCKNVSKQINIQRPEYWKSKVSY